jgi:hypothetical protein
VLICLTGKYSSAMSACQTIRLLEADPGLITFIARGDRAMAAEIQLPMRAIEPGAVEIGPLLAREHAFGAMILDGMLVESVDLGGHVGLRPMGVGDLFVRKMTSASQHERVNGCPTIRPSGCRAICPTSLALLDRALLVATRRWPLLLAGLMMRSSEQGVRLLTQLMICQLPRVDERLLSMLWLLADRWGHVTRDGTLLPIVLTHGTLGGLIGARRPTVTLALKDLVDRGMLMRRPEGWLLLDRAQPAMVRSSRPAESPAKQRVAAAPE